MAAGWNVMQSQSEKTLSDVALANVEALADENILPILSCPNYGCTIYFFYNCHVFSSVWGTYVGTCVDHRGS
jgi:predicted RNA-binding Zn ribbon-like protein